MITKIRGILVIAFTQEIKITDIHIIQVVSMNLLITKEKVIPLSIEMIDIDLIIKVWGLSENDVIFYVV